MKRLTAGCLRERITFLKRVLIQTSEGDYQETWKELGEVWAMIKPISAFNRQQGDVWHVMESQKAKGLYRVAMRKNINRNALHADLLAIIWKGKILDILFPFQLSSSNGFVETVVADHGKEKENG